MTSMSSQTADTRVRVAVSEAKCLRMGSGLRGAWSGPLRAGDTDQGSADNGHEQQDREGGIPHTVEELHELTPSTDTRAIRAARLRSGTWQIMRDDRPAGIPRGGTFRSP